MFNRIKSILFVICAVMVFTAQSNPPDDKGQRHAPAAGKPAAHAPVARPASHNAQSRSQLPAPRKVQAPRAAPQPQPVRRAGPTVQNHVSQPPRQESKPVRQEIQPAHEMQGPRVYAVRVTAPVVNNRFLNRQHHNHWRPRYNFYDNQYHFYPYVNITSPMELSADCVSVGFDGQNYYYDQGTFYLQDQSGQYEAIAPPLGVIVNAIPAQAHQIIVGGQTYYRYKGVFYVQVAGGYQVIGPVAPDPNS